MRRACRGPVQRIQSTACAHATVNPTWRQSLMFPCAPSRHDWPLTAVHVTVWDRDRFLPDRLIGYITVKLTGIKQTCNTKSSVIPLYGSMGILNLLRVCYGALCNRAGHYIFALWFVSIFFFFLSSPNLSGRRLDVYYTSTHGVALVQI